jgi:O-antigen/teichoic acid export membrane protein
MRRVMRNLGWLLGGRGMNALLSLVYLALATRSLGPVDFGQFAMIVGLGQAIAGLATFQTWQLIVSHGARHGRAGDSVGFAIALDGLSIVAGSALSALVIGWGADWLQLAPDLLVTAFVFCVLSLLSIRSTPTGILRLHDRYGTAAIAEGVTPVVRATGAVLAAWTMPTVTAFLAAWALGEIASAIAYWYFAAREERPRLAAVGLRGHALHPPSPWPFVWATNLSSSLSVASRQVLLLLVGAIGGPVLAGGFRVASQLGFALLRLAQSVSRAIYPELVRNDAAAPELVWRMTRLSAVIGLVAVGLAALFGRSALVLVAGPDFAFAHWAMVIIAAGAAVELASASAEALLVARGRPVTALVLRAIPTVGALALLPFAIGRAGLPGAAVCVLLASAFTFSGFLAWMRQSR